MAKIEVKNLSFSYVRKAKDKILKNISFQLEPATITAVIGLSGGQKQLVAVAAVLSLNPQVLIFDEPMSHLDEKGRQLKTKDWLLIIALPLLTAVLMVVTAIY